MSNSNPNSNSLTRRGAIRHQRRWSAPDDMLHRSASQLRTLGDDPNALPTPRTRRSRRRIPIGVGPPEAYARLGYENVSRFQDQTDTNGSDPPHSRQPTPAEFLSVQVPPVPSSPAPSYHSLGYIAVRRPAIHVRSHSLASSVGSLGSLPEYDNIGEGPPTHPGYSNYIIPGTEMNSDADFWTGLEPSYWVAVPFVTDPSMPLCPGFADGSCPISESHHSGQYFLECRAPSTLLMDILARHQVEHCFEGSLPPVSVWVALLQRITGQETEASEDLLFRFRWWHCAQYRNRVIARRQPRFDISQSLIYRRRFESRNLRAWIETGEEIDWDAVQFSDDGDESAEQLSVADEIPIQISDPNESTSADDGETAEIDATYIFLPSNRPSPSHYFRYGFIPPTEYPMGTPDSTIPPYPPCLSPLCPISYSHSQGPFWDTDPLRIPTSLIPGPLAYLRDERIYAAYLDALGEHGLGDLFSPETRPPLFVVAAVNHTLREDGTASSALDIVERFRFFHSRGVRPIVGPGEEIEGHEEAAEDTEDIPTP